ncbi:hypothetical protein [Magpiepox virus]|nr:hypothetical protein [Magpiepox virus]
MAPPSCIITASKYPAAIYKISDRIRKYGTTTPISKFLHVCCIHIKHYVNYRLAQ